MVLLNDVGNISRGKGKIFWINNFYKHPLFEKCIFTTTTCALIHILDCETIFPFGITKLHWSSLSMLICVYMLTWAANMLFYKEVAITLYNGMHWMCVVVYFVVIIVYRVKFHIHKLLHQVDFTNFKAIELFKS